MAQPPTKEQVLEKLRAVRDPELGHSIVDLGLVYDVAVSDTGACAVRYTLTSPACPFGDALQRDVRDALEPCLGVSAVSLQLVFDPPWGPERIAPSLRRELRLQGLAV